ncbi:hypothetical protein [Priestia megaterium]|uniref:hypothetical protein n=1 Tax=Priestia megaterium TaxID=1404 RepID=UPI000BFDA159|nr:hypothetical protein [Priestia megaterium]PGY54149.1 hypothetical protein COE35_03920 [Priestia megaterium]
MDIFGTLTVSTVISALITFIGGLFVKSYLPTYMKERGKNLATKKDIADITRKTEEVKSEFLSKLELEKKEINIEIEKVKLEQNQLFKNFELFTQKRHECYPELYKLLEVANGQIRKLRGSRRTLTFQNVSATDIENFMRERNFTSYDVDSILQNWDNNKPVALQSLNNRLRRIEYEDAWLKYIEANDYFFFNQIYMSDDVERIAYEIKNDLHDLWLNYDLDIGVAIPLEENQRLIQKIDLNRQQLKSIMREELYRR